MSDAKVIFDYDAEADDELTLKEGDLIRNIEKKEDGWWEGELYGRRGMFPENFVQEIKKSAPDKRVEKPPASNDKTALAKVTFDYTAENDDELTLTEGDMVKVLSQEEEGWWKGELHGRIGVFPANFVELVKGSVLIPGQTEPVPEPTFKEPAEKVESPEKKAKKIGGMGFGGILTQDALSGIKLRKSASGSSVSQNQKPEQPEQQSELQKRLSMKRNPPKIPDPERNATASKPKEKALVEFDYDGEQSDELTLRKGEILVILEKDVSEGWSKGELDGKVGLFPDNFVKLLPPEEPRKEGSVNKNTDMPVKKPPMKEDMEDNKPIRPDFPFPQLKKTERPPPPQQPNDSGRLELPVSLKPVPKPEENAKSPMVESKPGPEEKAPKLPEKPVVKKSPPSLPKKPDKPEKPGKPEKPKPPADLPARDRPHSPSTSRKPPPVVLRHINGPDKDPNKRFSAIPPTNEIAHEAKLKRNSHGSEVALDLNDIKSAGVLQPLTTDRPKNTAKNPPTKYGKPHSPKKILPPEKIEPDWVKEKELRKPAEKPKKPPIPDSSKPKVNESTMDSIVVKQLQNEIKTLKESLEAITKKFQDHVQITEKRFQKVEKKLMDEVEDLTKELDEEKKARSAVDVEVNRLRKLIKNQQTS